MAQIISVSWVKDFIKSFSGGVLHLDQVHSLSMGVFGAMLSKRLTITEIGRSFARHTGRCPKHAIKQIDRLVGNKAIATEEMFSAMCHAVIGARKKILVTLDWTEYDDTDQSRITVNLVTRHGRATPLVWLTVEKSSLKNHRTHFEKKVLRLLARSIPEGVKVIVVADRGFGSTAFFSYIKKKLGWDYIIRIKGFLEVYDEWHPLGRKVEDVRLVRGGPARRFGKVGLTKKKYPLENLVAVWDRGMKEPWYLATSLTALPETVVKYYSRRFTCEEHYRDEKDDRFGMGSSETRVGSIERRNMLTLIHCIATIILTILGAAGEHIGYDRRLRANTEKRRTHSLWRQGREYVGGMESRFLKSFKYAIKLIMAQHTQLADLYGVI
jgi:hypothetical protein